MAKAPYIVKKGDTLSEIAVANGTTYQKLAAINGIKNPNLIYVNQVIRFEKDTSSTKTTSDDNRPTITHFGLLSTDTDTIFATWLWKKGATTGEYKLRWKYQVHGKEDWFYGNSGSNSVDEHDPAAARQSSYSIPSNASKISFEVKPIARDKSTNGAQSGDWVADWSKIVYYTIDSEAKPPAVPSAPSVTIEGTKLTARLDNLPDDVDEIVFKVVKAGTTAGGEYESAHYKQSTAKVLNGVAVCMFTVVTGYEYTVRCQAIKNSMKSDWGPYSAAQKTAPGVPAWDTNTPCRASSKTSVILKWNQESTATSYEIEYANTESAFEGSNKTTKVSNIETTTYELDGLETGKHYYFRVRAARDQVSSGWSSLVSTALGSAPSAPTTWSSTTTAITGEPLTLYWVHNTEDGSSQTYAEIDLWIDEVEQLPTIRIKNSTDEDEKDKTSAYPINTYNYPEGTKLEWRVRTMGVTNTYGDYSIMRTVNIYAQPTFEDLSVTDSNGEILEVIETFPFYLNALAAPKTQVPIGYHVRVVANESYDTVDRLGNETVVSADSEVYSKYFDTTDDLLVEFSADNIDLANNVSYTIYCKVSMDSGLTAEDSIGPITVQWNESIPQPNAEIGIYNEACTAHIRPYCESFEVVNYIVTRTGSRYTKTEETVDDVYGTITSKYTTTGDRVWSGTDADGNSIYYCEVEEREPVPDISLSVYRREFDGSLTEIATGIDNATNTYVHDPHPALDYARYRIVATSTKTGAVNYMDVPGYPVNIKAVVIQWDERWSDFDLVDEGVLEQPAWTGSLLRLPYNIDISDDHQPDVALIEYIGRNHPVSYYGTQLGSTSTWKVDIPKDDKDTLHTLRCLARWMGDAYVREPSGSGYWANVTVSFSQTHCEKTIPVNLKVVRVEGGM